MLDWMATNSLFALLFGNAFDYATRNQGEIKRKSIGIGALTCAVIWLFCLFGEILIPPLMALRQCCDETAWIAGKIVLGLLALPVGFPIAYVAAHRRLQRRAEQAASEESTPADPIHTKARNTQRMYEVVVGILLWVWFWFFSPATSWLAQEGQAMLAQTMLLLAIWLILAVLLGMGGGRIVCRFTERHLRRQL